MKGLDMQQTGKYTKTDKDRYGFSPRPQEEHSYFDTLIFAQWNIHQIYGPLDLY